MKETKVYLVPEYFSRFQCKMGRCRHSCCEGWPVTVSLRDYYRLMNTECNADVKRRIELALHILPHPTEDEYAEISHDYTGSCRLHMADGRCALHAGAGEDALPPICRLYPRGLRVEGNNECSCACSCERTLELLYECKAPMRFVPHEMTLEVPEYRGRTVFFETFDREQELRLHLISIVQDRRLPLWKRLVWLSDRINALEEAFTAKNEDALARFLEECAEPEEIASVELTKDDLSDALVAAEELVSMMDARSSGTREYGESALAYFGQDTVSRYESAKARFEALFPDWECFFEQIIVNHMFFARFPFQDRPETVSAEKLSLDALYALLRFVTLGNIERLRGLDDLVDILHGLFRLIDHTSFDRYAGAALEKLRCGARDKQIRLLML